MHTLCTCLTFLCFLAISSDIDLLLFIFSVTPFSLDCLCPPFVRFILLFFFTEEVWLRFSLYHFYLVHIKIIHFNTFNLIFSDAYYFSPTPITYLLLGHMIKVHWGTCRSLFHQLLHNIRWEQLSCWVQSG